MKKLSEHSDAHLLERFQSLARNLFFENGALYCPLEVRPLFDAAQFEVSRRGLKPRLEVEDWIRPTDPAPTFHRLSLVRYGETIHLQELRAGKVSFGPAVIYHEQPNLAQRDNETVRKSHLPNTILTIAGVDYSARDLVSNHGIESPSSVGQGYHLLSLSIEESPKLQRAFKDECYVLILNFDSFQSAIRRELKEKFGDAVGLESRSVKYYDDLDKPNLVTAGDFAFSKSIHYQYQHEVRIVVYGAPNPLNRLEIQVDLPDETFSEIRHF